MSFFVEITIFYRSIEQKQQQQQQKGSSFFKKIYLYLYFNIS